MLCREQSLVKTGDGWGVARPLCCRSWGCEYCAPRRRSDLIRRAAAGRPTRLLTLTTNPALYGSPAQRAHELANAWRKVVKRAQRQLGWGKPQYFAVFERTKRGEPHLHILIRGRYLPQSWLSKQMKELIGAPICDIRKVHSERGAAAYVAKYLGKDPHRFGTCKRYWATRGYDLTAVNADRSSTWELTPWQITREPVEAIWRAWQRSYRAPSVSSEGVAWYGAPPANGPWNQQPSQWADDDDVNRPTGTEMLLAMITTDQMRGRAVEWRSPGPATPPHSRPRPDRAP